MTQELPKEHPLYILIVEDMELMQEALTSKLSQLHSQFPNARFTSVGTLRAGLELVSQIPHPDVTFLDLTLTDAKWQETIARLSDFENCSPVIVITGNTESEAVEMLAKHYPDIEVLHKDPTIWDKVFEAIVRAWQRGRRGNLYRIEANIRKMKEMQAHAPEK